MQDSSYQQKSENVTPLMLFTAFLPIGAFTFGGGYAMIPLIKKSIVDRYHWMEERDFIDSIAIAQSAPGPIAINMAALTGRRLAGIPGAIASVIAAALPSFISILIIAAVFLGIQHNPFVRAAMKGMRPAIVALMAAAVFDVGKAAIATAAGVGLAAIAFAGLTLLHMHPIVVIILAATAGFFMKPARDEGKTPEKDDIE
ncbi:MAG TPA: chromate transporter [Firmicutes bacterium]|nr:chromate transporter [Bacillota bacterium]